ncbi:MAG: VOC family protein [Acidimicrobiia bacterium]
MATPIQIVFDCADPANLAEFWATALGYATQPPPPGFASWEAWAVDVGIPEERWNDAAAVVDPDDAGPRLFFQKVPEGKTTKNRLHLDIGVGKDIEPEHRSKVVETEADRLVAAGASVVRHQEQRNEFWIVMQDPEGNEFCVH